MTEPVRACAVDELADGTAMVLPPSMTGWSDGIAIFHDSNEFFALNDTCTHGNASLAEGWIEGGEVECPLHSGRVCLKNGEAMSMPISIPSVPHKVEVRDGAVWVFPGVAPDA